MEKLALCSKILYDREIIESAKKIKMLEKEVKYYKNGPEPFYESIEAYESTVHSAIKKLKTEIGSMYDDTFEHDHMVYQGITSRHHERLTYAISDCLCEVTRDRNWSDVKSEQIMTGVWSFVKGFMHCNMWENLYMSLTRHQLGNLIFNMIVHTINGPHRGTILENVIRFRCHECDNVTPNVNMNNACSECDQKKIYVNF